MERFMIEEGTKCPWLPLVFNDGNKIALFIIVDFGLVWKWRWCGTALGSIWGFVNALGLYLLHS